MDFQKPDRELPIGDTLSWTFEIYTSHFAVFFIPFLVASIVTGSFSLLIGHYASSIPLPDSTQSLDVYLAELMPYLTNLIMLFLAFSLVSWVTAAITTGISTKCASDIIQRGRTSLEEAFRFTFTKLVSLLPATLIVGIIVLIGTIALIIPGIIFMVMFAVVPPVIVNENVGAIDSLSRSRKLASNRWLKTFTLILVVGIIIFFAYFIASLLAAPFGQFSGLVSNILVSVIAPIAPVAITIHYYSMTAKDQQKGLLPPPPPF